MARPIPGAGDKVWNYSTPTLRTGMLQLDGSHPDAQAFIQATYK